MLSVHIKRHVSIHYVLIHVLIINAHKEKIAMWIIINRSVYISVSSSESEQLALEQFCV